MAGRRGATVALLVLGVVAISFAPILVRLAAIPALSLAFWRCLAGAVLLAPWALATLWRAHHHRMAEGVRQARGIQAWRARLRFWGGLRGGASSPPERSGDLPLLLASGVLLATHFALFNASLALTTVASSAVLVSSSPLFVALAAGPLLGEATPARAWLGIFLAVAGAVAVGLGDAGRAAAGDGDALLGDAMALAGAAAMAGYLLLGRAARRRLPVATYAGAVYATAAAVLLPACLLTGAPLAGYEAGSWLAVGGVIAGPQLLGHTVFNGLLATVTAGLVAVVTLTEPVGATLLAWALFGELPGGWFWAGAPLVLAGVWLSASSERLPSPAPGTVAKA